MSVSALSVIISIMVVSLVGAGIREISNSRKKRSVEKSFDKKLSSSSLWSQLFHQEWSQPADSRPPLRALQALAKSLVLPDYELVSNSSQINEELLPAYHAEVGRRNNKFPNLANMRLVNRIRMLFPPVQEQEISNIGEKMDAAQNAFSLICALDNLALDHISLWLSFSDSEKRNSKMAEVNKSRNDVLAKLDNNRRDTYTKAFTTTEDLAVEVNKIKLEALFPVRCNYYKACIEVQQAILRLAVSPELHSSLSGVAEVIKETVGKSQDTWNKLVGDTWKQLEDRGLTQWAAMETTCIGALHNSPRWSAYPLLKGEYLLPLETNSAALTNYLFVCKAEKPPTLPIIPLPLVEAVKESRFNGRKTFEFSMRDGNTIHIVKAVPPGFQMLQQAVKSSQGKLDQSLMQLLLETKTSIPISNPIVN